MQGSHIEPSRQTRKRLPGRCSTEKKGPDGVEPGESFVAYGVGLLGKARHRKHANRREGVDGGSIKLSILL
jgi:hypothetical protein